MIVCPSPLLILGLNCVTDPVLATLVMGLAFLSIKYSVKNFDSPIYMSFENIVIAIRASARPFADFNVHVNTISSESHAISLRIFTHQPTFI